LFAKEFDDYIIAQEYISGNTYRILVIDGKFEAAVQVLPSIIIGDGTSTVKTLIDSLNLDPLREFGDKGKLSKVKADEDTIKILELKGHKLESVLPAGEKVYLKNSGNMKLGGKSIDVTDKVNEYNRFICERISKIINLDVAGIDLISEDIAIPFNENDGCVIEVNAAPDFRIHIKPFEGKSRLVQRSFVDMLFPKGQENRIPVISITGSKGKSITSDIVDKCLIAQGLITGVVCIDGLFVAGKCLNREDVTDKSNAEIILKDPTIDCAIFETPVETILNSGLGYEFADIGVVLNIHDNKKEYFQYDHIFDIEDIAYAKAVVAEEVYETGFSVLNADDPLMPDIAEQLYSTLVYFSINEKNKTVKDHIENDGIGVVLDGDIVYIFDEKNRVEIIRINDMKLFADNKDEYKLHSVLAAVAVLYLYEVPNDDISDILKSYTQDN